jgi:hypothetical protein
MLQVRTGYAALVADALAPEDVILEALIECDFNISVCALHTESVWLNVNTAAHSQTFVTG